MAVEPKTKTTDLAQMEGLVMEKLAQGGSVTFSPKGTSMLPMLRAAGDSVTLKKPSARLKKGTVALFISHDEEGKRKFVLHRLVKYEGDALVFMGDNRRFCDPPADREDVIGVVCAFTRKGREHSCSAPWYVLYSAVMTATRGTRLALSRIRGFLYRIWKRIRG